MPYILRSDDGKVKAVSNSMIAGWEEVEVGDTEYAEYLATLISKEDKFRETDIQLARVLEDLISLLIDRDFIRFTDFPEPAQKRLIEREALRARKTQLNLLAGDDDF
jgi:hypothetical protein